MSFLDSTSDVHKLTLGPLTSPHSSLPSSLPHTVHSSIHVQHTLLSATQSSILLLTPAGSSSPCVYSRDECRIRMEHAGGPLLPQGRHLRDVVGRRESRTPQGGRLTLRRPHRDGEGPSRRTAARLLVLLRLVRLFLYQRQQAAHLHLQRLPAVHRGVGAPRSGGHGVEQSGAAGLRVRQRGDCMLLAARRARVQHSAAARVQAGRCGCCGDVAGRSGGAHVEQQRVVLHSELPRAACGEAGRLGAAHSAHVDVRHGRAARDRDRGVRVHGRRQPHSGGQEGGGGPAAGHRTIRAVVYQPVRPAARRIQRQGHTAHTEHRPQAQRVPPRHRRQDTAVAARLVPGHGSRAALGGDAAAGGTAGRVY